MTSRQYLGEPKKDFLNICRVNNNYLMDTNFFQILVIYLIVTPFVNIIINMYSKCYQLSNKKLLYSKNNRIIERKMISYYNKC